MVKNYFNFQQKCVVILYRPKTFGQLKIKSFHKLFNKTSWTMIKKLHIKLSFKTFIPVF